MQFISWCVNAAETSTNNWLNFRSSVLPVCGIGCVDFSFLEFRTGMNLITGSGVVGTEGKEKAAVGLAGVFSGLKAKPRIDQKVLVLKDQ